jgi:hypothetical protein
MYERLHATIKTKFLLPHTYVILIDFGYPVLVERIVGKIFHLVRQAPNLA